MPEDSDWSPMLYEISEAGARAASLTQQLLNYSRKQVVDRRVLDMNDVVRKMENMLRQLIGEDIQLIIDYHDGKATVIADAGQIGQVIMNLVVNARDAMPKGGTLRITIRVRELSEELLHMHPESPPGRFVQLSVRDNGAGISADLLDRIFEPFFTTKNAGMGTGLGLASVRSIAETVRDSRVSTASQVREATFSSISLRLTWSPPARSELRPRDRWSRKHPACRGRKCRPGRHASIPRAFRLFSRGCRQCHRSRYRGRKGLRSD